MDSRLTDCDSIAADIKIRSCCPVCYSAEFKFFGSGGVVRDRFFVGAEGIAFSLSSCRVSHGLGVISGRNVSGFNHSLAELERVIAFQKFNRSAIGLYSRLADC